LRAVRDGDLPELPAKRPPGDWWDEVADLVDLAPDSKVGPDELRRIDRWVGMGKLRRDQPIITMGESASRDVPHAANAGGPAPTLLASPNAVPRIILPDGRVKKVTPEMMKRLMGLPDDFKVPGPGRGGGFGPAKEVLGNGIHAATTRAFIQPLAEHGAARRNPAPTPSAAGSTLATSLPIKGKQ